LRDPPPARNQPAGAPQQARRGQTQALRQTAQPALWSEATIRQPAGASGHPAWAGFPVGHPASTTVVPGGSDWWPGLRRSISVQETSNTWGTHSIHRGQASEEVTATWSPGRSLPASINAIAACEGGSSVCETWPVIWATTMRLTADTQTPNVADTAASDTPGRSLRSTNAKPIHTASMTSVTAVASGTL